MLLSGAGVAGDEVLLGKWEIVSCVEVVAGLMKRWRQKSGLAESAIDDCGDPVLDVIGSVRPKRQRQVQARVEGGFEKSSKTSARCGGTWTKIGCPAPLTASTH